jgi:hypothetical protein
MRSGYWRHEVQTRPVTLLGELHLVDQVAQLLLLLVVEQHTTGETFEF